MTIATTVAITINGQTVQAEPGRRLVEVIKDAGVAITNLCYIDGLEPYAGCRTCLVEIEGGRPLAIQLSCTAQVAEGMAVNTETEAVKFARQSVMSIINANHPDRCLTCHRRVHCAPGDICLRDDVVSHRCLTCAKNYRCELQTSNEILDMGEFEEPWVGEQRSYYETPPPEPDRGNPYLEFDPQMCILCARCVRACADLRHTDAISLAGKGFSTRIAFGAGGPVHESDCDFCGACIDVCPTATLMEKPNKWVGRADDWTSSVCNSCAVGCTISYGTIDSQPVIVRPDRMNPVSRDQICVRGRFGYDAITRREQLTRNLARRGDNLLPVSFDDALGEAVEALTSTRREHGAGSIAVLGSPLATNEEAHLLSRLAVEAIGTPHLDFSHGAVHRAVQGAISEALGVERLPSSLTDIERADTIVVLGGDLEQSHQIVSLRIKDAVVKRSAKLVLVSARWGELVPFAEAWLQPAPGGEAAAVQALAQAIAGDAEGGSRIEAAGVGDRDALGVQSVTPAGVTEQALAAGSGAVRAGASGDGTFAVVFAPDAVSAAQAAEGARAATTLAIAARPGEAASSLHYLPTDANVLGIADIGVAPRDGGRDFAAIVEGAQAGDIHALIVHRDNPLLNAPGSDEISAALEAVEHLIVIDSVRSTASEHAAVVLAEQPFHASRGTLTTADRRIVIQRDAMPVQRDERSALEILAALIRGLEHFAPDSASEVADEIADRVAGYVPHADIESGRTRALGEPSDAREQFVMVAAPAAAEGLRVITGRPLFTSWQGASIRSEEADKLHREEQAVVNPSDAEAAGVRSGDDIVLSDGTHELRIAALLDDGVAPGTVYVPHYYDGGAVMALFPLDGAAASAAVQLRRLQPA